jgi:hypothetical protein
MIRIWVGVYKEAEGFAVAVYAKSIRRALGAAKARYPDGHVGMIFPIQPDGFFVRDSDVDALIPTAKPGRLYEIVDIEPSEQSRRATCDACIG